MSKAFVPEGQSVGGRLAWPLVAYAYDDDDDDDEADDETDFDERDEPSVRQHDRWFTCPGFGSPEWWSGT